MKRILLLLLVVFTVLSCERYDERVLPIVGIYQGQVVGVTRPFKFSISAKYGDNLLIDAPMDGDIWDVVTLDINNKNDERMSVRIPFQYLEDGVTIKGEGFYTNGTLQLDYSISVDGQRRNFKLVGEQW